MLPRYKILSDTPTFHSEINSPHPHPSTTPAAQLPSPPRLADQSRRKYHFPIPRSSSVSFLSHLSILDYEKNITSNAHDGQRIDNGKDSAFVVRILMIRYCESKLKVTKRNVLRTHKGLVQHCPGGRGFGVCRLGTSRLREEATLDGGPWVISVTK